MSGESLEPGVSGGGTAARLPAFWFDRECHHIVHRRRDGSLVYIGYDCTHDHRPDE